jgi:peptide deformylase
VPNLLEIKYHGNPVLHQIAEKVDIFDSALKNIISDMIFTMYHNDGVGLAAPQVGFSKRLFVIDDFSEDTETKNAIVLINPEILEVDGEIIKEEGCLSLPGVFEKIKRFEYVKIQYFDFFQKSHILEAEDLFAVALQHEYDHVDGITLFNKFNKITKMSHAFKLKKISEKGCKMSSEVTIVSSN